MSKERVPSNDWFTFHTSFSKQTRGSKVSLNLQPLRKDAMKVRVEWYEWLRKIWPKQLYTSVTPTTDLFSVCSSTFYRKHILLWNMRFIELSTGIRGCGTNFIVGLWRHRLFFNHTANNIQWKIVWRLPRQSNHHDHFNAVPNPVNTFCGSDQPGIQTATTV